MLRIFGRTFLLGLSVGVLSVLLVVAMPLVGGRPTTGPTGPRSPWVSSGKAADAGYLGVVTRGNISTHSAEFGVPSVSCQPSLPEAQVVGVHVGASGVLLNGTTVEVGMNLNVICDLGSSSPRFAPLAYDCLGANCTTLTVFALTISIGDDVTFHIQTDPLAGKVAWKMTDQSTHASASWTENFHHGVNLTRAFWEVGGPTYPCTPTSCAQALAKFSGQVSLRDGGLTVSGTHVEVGALAYLIRYTMVDSIDHVLARCSPLSKNGSTFSVTWIHST